MQSLVKQITLLINDLMNVYVRKAPSWGDLKSVKLEQLIEVAREFSNLQSSVILQVNELMPVYVRVASYSANRVKLMVQLLELVRECTTLQSSFTLLVREFTNVYVREASYLDYLKRVKLMEDLFELARECTALQSLVKQITPLLVNELRILFAREAHEYMDLKHVDWMEHLLELAREWTTLQSSVALLVRELMSVHIRELRYLCCSNHVKLMEQLLELTREYTTLQSSVTLLLQGIRSVYFQKARFLGDLRNVKLMEQLVALVKECTSLQSSGTLLVNELRSMYIQEAQFWDSPIQTELLAKKVCTTLQSLIKSVTLLVNELRSIYVQEAQCLGYSKHVLTEQLLELVRECTTLQSSVMPLVCELMSIYDRGARYLGYSNHVKLTEQLLELARECTTLQSSVTPLVRELMSMYVRGARYLGYSNHVKLMEQLVELTRECTTLQSSVTLLVCELRRVYFQNARFCVDLKLMELWIKECTSLQSLVTLLVNELIHVLQEAQFWCYPIQTELLAKVCTTLQSWVKSVTLLVNELRSINAQEARCNLGSSKCLKLMEQLLELARECSTMHSSVMLVHELMSVHVEEEKLGDLKILTLIEQLLPLFKECTSLQSSVTLLVNELKGVYLQEARCLGYSKHEKLMERMVELTRECTTVKSSATLLVFELMSAYIKVIRHVGDQKSVELMEQLLVFVKECSTLQSSVTLLVNEVSSMHVQKAQYGGYSRQTELLAKKYTALRSLINSVTLQVEELLIQEPPSRLVKCMQLLCELVKECITLLYSTFQSDLIILNVLNKTHLHQDLTLVEQTMNYTALQPLNELPLFFTCSLLFSLSNNNYLSCTGPQPVILINWKLDTRNSTTVLSSNFQSELILENVLDKARLHQDLTLVEQTMNYIALQPLNELPLFLTGSLLFSLSNTNYLTCTGPQLVILNINWKLDACNSTTILSSNFQSELILENVLDKTHLHHDLAPVEQSMDYIALQPLNKQPLLLTGTLLFSLINNNYLTCTGPQLVILNSRKPDTCNSWPFHFGVTAFKLYVKHWFNIEGVLNRLVILCGI